MLPGGDALLTGDARPTGRAGAASPHRPARSAPTSPASRRRRGAVRRWLPPQHGAWAMLLVPYLLGVFAGGAAWVHLPLLVAWLSGYLWSYYALLAVKTRRTGRVRRQLLTYGGVAAVAAAAVVAVAPRVLLAAPAYGLLLAVNAWQSWRRDDRSLLTDLASVIQACLMVPVAVLAAGAELRVSATPALVALLYFAGTVLYVKTMIRERGSRRYLVGSVAFHLAACAVACVVSWPLGALFTALAARAVLLPRHRLTPRQVGLLEIVASVALLLLVPATT